MTEIRVTVSLPLPVTKCCETLTFSLPFLAFHFASFTDIVSAVGIFGRWTVCFDLLQYEDL